MVSLSPLIAEPLSPRYVLICSMKGAIQLASIYVSNRRQKWTSLMVSFGLSISDVLFWVERFIFVIRTEVFGSRSTTTPNESLHESLTAEQKTRAKKSTFVAKRSFHMTETMTCRVGERTVHGYKFSV